MRVLVDTGVWSLALRRTDGHLHPETEELRRLVMAHVAEIIGPVRQEILSGVRDRPQFARLETHLDAFPDVPLLSEDFVTAAKFFNLCRSKSIQGSNTDFLILPSPSDVTWPSLLRTGTSATSQNACPLSCTSSKKRVSPPL